MRGIRTIARMRAVGLAAEQRRFRAVPPRMSAHDPWLAGRGCHHVKSVQAVLVGVPRWNARARARAGGLFSCSAASDGRLVLVLCELHEQLLSVFTPPPGIFPVPHWAAITDREDRLTMEDGVPRRDFWGTVSSLPS